MLSRASRGSVASRSRRRTLFAGKTLVSPLLAAALLLVYAGLMVGLTRVADSWIVALAITPLIFALLLSLGCLLAYRRDFYA